MRLVLVVLLLLVGASAEAQDRPLIDVTGGFSFGRPTAINRKLGAIETFGGNGQGTSFENDLEFGVCVELPHTFGEHSNLLLSLAYIRGNGEFKSNPFLYRVASQDERILVEGALKQALLPWLFARGGLWASYRIRESLVEDSLSINKKSGDSLATSRFHFGIPLGIGSKIGLSNKLACEPELFARVDVGEVFRGFSQDAFSIGGRIAVTYDLTASAAEAPKPVAPPPSHLRSAVHFEVGGVSADRVTSMESDTIVHRYMMLPTQYMKNDMPLFPQAGASVGDVLDNETAIIAHRTRELDTVQLKANDPRLFAPYVDQWQEKSSVVPNITISKYIESEAGVRSWKIDVLRSGATVATLSDDSMLNSGALDRVFNYRSDRARDTIVARLKAVDVKGTIAATEDTLIVTSGTERAGTTVKDQFYILCDTNTTATSWKPALIARAAHSANAKSTITISPLTGASRQCSHQIAAELLAILAKEHITVNGVHEVSTASAVTMPSQYEHAVLVEVVTPEN